MLQVLLDSDDDVAPSTQRMRGEVTAEVHEHLVSNVVRLLLFNEARHALTKRADLLANAIGGEFKVRTRLHELHCLPD